MDHYPTMEEQIDAGLASLDRLVAPANSGPGLAVQAGAVRTSFIDLFYKLPEAGKVPAVLNKAEEARITLQEAQRRFAESWHAARVALLEGVDGPGSGWTAEELYKAGFRGIVSGF